MDEVTSLINVVPASTKRRDDFETVVRELLVCGAMPQAGHLPTYDK